MRNLWITGVLSVLALAGPAFPEVAGEDVTTRTVGAGEYMALLADRFGIDPGADFVSVLEEAVAACDVFIAMIGPYWLTLTGFLKTKEENRNPRQISFMSAQ